MDQMTSLDVAAKHLQQAALSMGRLIVFAANMDKESKDAYERAARAHVTIAIRALQSAFQEDEFI